MFFRAIALSVALLVGLGTIIPLTTDYAEAGVRKQKKKKKRAKKYKKYSRAWWRAYRQRTKGKNSLAQRRRALRLRQIRLARANKANENTNPNQNSKSKANGNTMIADSSPALLPTGETAPQGWRRGTISNSASELQFRVDDAAGAQIGSASIALVGPATGADNNNARNKTLGGVSTTALRGTVIDRMIKEEGWVVNDFQKEIGGKKVYVVAAQSPGIGGAVQSRMFYFTEVDGRIYSVATSAPKEASEKIVQESEKVIFSLQRKPNPVQQADLK